MFFPRELLIYLVYNRVYKLLIIQFNDTTKNGPKLSRANAVMRSIKTLPQMSAGERFVPNLIVIKAALIVSVEITKPFILSHISYVKLFSPIARNFPWSRTVGYFLTENTFN